MTRRAAFALTAVLLSVAACGPSQSGRTTPATGSRPAGSTSAATLADGCGIPGRDRLRPLVGYDAAPPALLLGNGTRGVVLSNQSNYVLCQWFPFARTLADRGYLVLLYNYASGDAVADVRAAVATIRFGPPAPGKLF